MTKHLKVLVHNYPELAAKIKGLVGEVHQSDNPKNLVRLLLEKDIDFVACRAASLTEEHIKKIHEVYLCPFVFVGKNKDVNTNHFGFYWAAEENLLTVAVEKSADMEILRMRRRNRELIEIIEAVKKFEVSVENVARELFISEIKEFFIQSLKAKDSLWLDVQRQENSLPLILVVKQELQRQPINMDATISDLNRCETEILAKPTYQVWKQDNGHYIALIWLESGYKYSQCLILKGIEFSRLEKLSELLHYLIPIINRRWSICCKIHEAQEEVYRDSLTKLYNQKFLNEILHKKIEETKRYKTPFTILFIDIDHFKKVNDSMGHVVGSTVLIGLGNLIYSCIRQTDYAFRYGGDEFIVLLAHTESDNADFVAERIRQKVEDAEFEAQGRKVKITVSIGLASYPTHASSAVEIIQIADEAMYYGKNKSRNIVYKASS